MAKKQAEEISIESLRKIAAGKWGEDTVLDPDRAVFNEDPLTTGVFAFDLATGGGIPVGRITEVAGDFSSGKTLLAEQVAANVQAENGIVIWISTEDQINADFASKVGLDLKNMLIFENRYVEEIYDFIETMLKQLRGEKRHTVIVWDSIAQSESKQVLDSTAEEQTMNDKLARAQANSAGMRRVAPMFVGTKVAGFFINQLRDKPGVLYGPTTDTTGGRGIKFACSLRISLFRGKKIVLEKDGDPVAVYGRFEVVKSKVCPPFRSVEFVMSFDHGIGPLSGLLPYLVKHGLIKQGTTGGWYSVDVGGGKVVNFQSSGPWHSGLEQFIVSPEGGPWLDEVLKRRFV